MKTRSQDAEWGLLLEELPRGWQQYGIESGAVKRLRGIRDMRTLMRALMVHIAGGYSLRTTTVMARTAGWGTISPVALWKRLRASEEWFRGIVRSWTDGHGGVSVAGKMHLVDGTHVAEPGPTGSVWRIHYRFTMPTLECTEVEITDNKTAEGFKNFTIPAGEWLVADSAYARAPQIAYAVKRKARVIVRVPWGTLPLYDRNRQLLPLLLYGRRLKPLASTEREAWIHVKDGGPDAWIPGKVCIIKKTLAAAAESKRRKIRDTRRKTGRLPQRDTLEAAEYVMVWTNEVAVPRKEILDRYRCRWQVELSFKRMKSLVAISALPKHDAHSARAWLYGKLMVALWVERLMERGARFSPWHIVAPEDLFRACFAPQRVARMGIHAVGGADDHSAQNSADVCPTAVEPDSRKPRGAFAKTHAAN